MEAFSTFFVGGARSGKSRLAEELAASSSDPVSVVVTAEPIDDEMVARITRHQDDRPSDWQTIEAPYDLAAAIGSVERTHTLLIDCITIWLSNLIVRGDDDNAVEGAIEETLQAILAHPGSVIVVSNETGLGLVPPDPMSRRFRDLQGRANQRLASELDRSFFVAAGQLLPLQPPSNLLPIAQPPI